MRILVYKRTHSGDPDAAGRFGIKDCMGGVRGRIYDAVIGIGGDGPEPRRNGIAGKLTWIGIGPRQIGWRGRGPIVGFEHFLYYGEAGPELAPLAPVIAQHMYEGRVRVLINMSDDERKEAEAIVRRARPSPPSAALNGSAHSELLAEPRSTATGHRRHC